MGRDDERLAGGRKGAELRVEQREPVVVERRVRLVEHDEVGLVEQGPAERETLRHAPRVRGDALTPRLPQTEAPEQHADALPSLRDAVEPSVEVEVLERGQLAIDERLVAEEADSPPFDPDLEQPP